MTKERLEYLLKGAEQEMCHGDYLPTIPERIELCKIALAQSSKPEWPSELINILQVAYKYMNETYGCTPDSDCDPSVGHHVPECCIAQDLWKALNIIRMNQNEKGAR